jgi:hypothetical protein
MAYFDEYIAKHANAEDEVKGKWGIREGLADQSSGTRQQNPTTPRERSRLLPLSTPVFRPELR